MNISTVLLPTILQRLRMVYHTINHRLNFLNKPTKAHIQNVENICEEQREEIES